MQTKRLASLGIGAAALLSVALATPAPAALWTGGVTGTQVWNVPTNWDTNPTVPNSVGAVAQIGGGSFFLNADNAAATTVTFGQLDLTTNHILQLGATGDLGSYVLENTGSSNVVINYNNITSAGRGVQLISIKTNHFTLNSNVVVNYVGGTQDGTFTISNTLNANNQVNGNNKTITLNGRIGYATTGNNSALKNGTVDVRNSTAATAVSIGSSTTVPASDNNKILIGKASGTQVVSLAGNMTFGYALELNGDVQVQNNGGRTWTMTGQITDNNATAKLKLVHNDTGNRTVTFTPATASTYRGGTTVDYYNSTTNNANHTLALNAAGALGVGDVDVTRLLNLTFGANYALGTNPTTSTNGITFASTSGLATINLGAFTQSLEFTKVGTNSLATGTYNAAALQSALQGAGLSGVTVSGAGSWIIVPIPEPASLALLALGGLLMLPRRAKKA